MKKDWALTQEAFEQLLAALDADRERAAEKYEATRRAIIRYFRYWNSPYPEEHTDETINRVARRVAEGARLDYLSTGYFVQAARRVIHEYWKIKETQPVSLESLPPGREAAYALPDPEEARRQEAARDEKERLQKCQQDCLNKLPAAKRDLLYDYYRGQRRAKIAGRSRLAERLGLPAGTLRVRLHRVRKELEECVKGCLDDAPA